MDLDGLSPVGTFVCRARGEVFLTDDDLANFEKYQVSLPWSLPVARRAFSCASPMKRSGDPQSRGV